MRRRTPRVLSAIIAAGALLLAPVVVPAATAAAPPTLSSDFEGGGYAPWAARGPATLALSDDAHSGSASLHISGRSDGWHGAAVPSASVFTAGNVPYTISAWVKLVAGQPAADINLGVNQPKVVDLPSWNEFPWVTNRATVTDAEWVHLTGTFTPNASNPPTQLYVESASTTAEFLVDDVVVTPGSAPAPVPAGQELVAWNDFTDGSLGASLQASGGTGVTFEDGALRVNGRNADHVGVETVPGLLEPGTQYTVSAKIKLAAGTPATEARWVGYPGYNWIGNAAVNADTWTTITGSWLAPTTAGTPAAPVDPQTVKFYIGTADITDVAAYDYLVDDILITTPTPAACEPTTVTVVDDDFDAASPVGDASLGSLQASGGTGVTFEDGALRVNGRNADHVGVETVPGLLEPGTQYTVSAKIKLAAGTPATEARWVGYPGYNWIGNAAVNADTWTTITGSWLAPTTAGTPAAPVDPQTVKFYIGTADITDVAAYDYLVDDILITKQVDDCDDEGPVQAPGTVLIDSTFDDGTVGDWFARAGSGSSNPTVSAVEGGANGTSHAAQVSTRTHEGDGIQLDVKDVLLPGKTYAIEAYVRFAPDSEIGRGLSISMRTVTGTSSPSYANLVQIESPSATGWTKVTGEFTVPGYDANAELYFEARYNSGNTSTFLVDQVKVWVPEAQVVDTSLLPLKDSVDFPVGVAIDQRETTGSASELLLHHFDQISPENHMKVEAWYNADKQFVRNAQATALLDYAQENDLRMYGHVLLWHSQTPAWFFQDDSGRELTSSEADKQLLRDRLKVHVDNVAKSIYDDYGPYGSATNPIVAWDVVNEVIADQATPDGLRTSRWHDILGEEYIHLAFQYADEAFNDTYAAAGSDRPVKLFINDYNTEQDAKGVRYKALVERLLAADVPVDGVGHQFHVAITTSVASLAAAFDRFTGLGLLQEVTELDVTANPADQPNLIKQGYFYRDAFNVFRDYDAAAPASEKIFSVTVWGLTDNRSWRSSQKPLLFDDKLQAKPAYFGAVDDADGVPALINQANVFGGDVALSAGFEKSAAWTNLPEKTLTGDAGGFQTRWNADHLTVLVRTTADAERVEFTYGDAEYVYEPGAAGSVDGVDTTVGGVRYVAVHLPHSGVAANTSAQFDIRVVVDGAVAGAWNTAGSTGTLTFLEALSTVDIPEAATAPTVDGVIDAAWANAAVAQTGKVVEGNAEGAEAEVRTLWKGNTLYALYNVTDPVIDKSNSDPWNQDSVELFLDLGNSKSGAYGPNDTQIRVTTDNRLSFGSGDSAAQQARVLASATALTATGYVVEVAVDLVGQSGGQSDVPLGGVGTIHGIDFQVNDGRAAARYAVHTWAEPTGTGYQNTGRWGVARLVAGSSPEPTDPTDPTDPLFPDWATVNVGTGTVELGGSLPVTLTGLEPGQQVEAVLHSDPIVVTGIPAADANGRTTFTVNIPLDLELGAHTLVITSGDLAAIEVGIRVVAPGQLAATGAQLPLGIALAGALLLVLGGAFVLMRPRRRQVTMS